MLKLDRLLFLHAETGSPTVFTCMNWLPYCFCVLKLASLLFLYAENVSPIVFCMLKLALLLFVGAKEPFLVLNG